MVQLVDLSVLDCGFRRNDGGGGGVDQRETGEWDNGVPSWPARGVGQMGLLADTESMFSARESVPRQLGKREGWDGG